MSTVRLIQHRFTQGELDPKMLGRSDIDQYYGGAETMTNIVTMPQGGFKRRGGLEHIQKTLRILTATTPTVTATNGGTTGNATDGSRATLLTTTVNISTTNPYEVVRYDLTTSQSMAVAYIYDIKLSAGTSSQFYVQGSTDAVTWTTVGTALTLTTTAKDYSRRIDASYRYLRIARIGSTDLGTAKAELSGMLLFTNGALSESRHIDFEFSSTQSYLLLMTDKNIAVYKDGVFQIDLYLAELTSARLADINHTQSADTLLIFHEDFPVYKVLRNGGDDIWATSVLTFDNIPFHGFTLVSTTGATLGWNSATPAAISGATSISVADGVFTSAHLGQYFEGNGGRARIIGIISGTKVQVFVESPFYDTTAILNTDYTIETGYESSWSVTRGYPICGAFHEGRLWIGGSKSQPTTIWGSKSGIYYDFDINSVLDDDGIEVTLDNDQLNRITNVYSGRNLMVFTTGAEFIVPQTLGNPITPSNISISRQSRIGSVRGLPVFEIEGGIFYCQDGGQSVQEFIFNDTQQAYANNILSLMSGHLVKSPVSFALRRATSLDDGALLAMVRSDGNATIATVQRSQGVASFTNQTTDGTFKSCGTDYNYLYFVVERTINSVIERYFERLNDDHLLDASTIFTTGLPATVFTGLYQLEAETCRVVADGSVLPTVVPASGSATISRNATTSCEIGLWFQPIFKDLPCEVQGNTILGKKISISEIVVRLYETVTATINDKVLYFRSFGSGLLDVAPPEFTGTKRLMGWRGWTDTGQVTIKQDEPAPLTVLALSKRISFDG